MGSPTSSQENKKKKINSSEKKTITLTTQKKTLTPQQDVKLENKQIEPTSISKTAKKVNLGKEISNYLGSQTDMEVELENREKTPSSPSKPKNKQFIDKGVLVPTPVI